MKILLILIIFISTFFNSCAVNSQDKINKKMLSKIKQKEYRENLKLNKLFISEGHFECSKSLESNNRLESTSDGLYDSFLYITNDGKMYFTTIPSSNISRLNLSTQKNEIPNGIFYNKNGKYLTERKSVSHAIFGVGGGYLISKGEIFFKDNKIFLFDNSDKNHCEIYKEY